MKKDYKDYLVPAVLAFLFALALWQIQKERTALDYDVVSSEEFPRENGSGRYFVVRIRNTGTKEVRDIDLTLVLKSGAIETKRYSTPNLISQVSESTSELRGRIPLLNPGETFSVTMTTFGKTGVGSVDVTARAPGATAQLRKDDGGLSGPAGLLGFVIVSCAVAIGVSFFYSRNTAKLSESVARIENLGELSQRIEKTEEDLSASLRQQREALQKETEDRLNRLEKEEQEHEQGRPASVQIIFALLNRSGLGHRFTDLVAAGGELSYWRTGIFLIHSFLIDESNRDKYVGALEALLELPQMAPSSRGMTLYLLGKLEQYRGNRERAIQWLERCRTKTPLMYAHLMAQDPAYDLDKIREHLLNPTAISPIQGATVQSDQGIHPTTK